MKGMMKMANLQNIQYVLKEELDKMGSYVELIGKERVGFGDSSKKLISNSLKTVKKIESERNAMFQKHILPSCEENNNSLRRLHRVINKLENHFSPEIVRVFVYEHTEDLTPLIVELWRQIASSLHTLMGYDEGIKRDLYL